MKTVAVILALLPAIFGAKLPDNLDVDGLTHAMFVDADTDSDGILHRTELVAVFTKYDSNHDGRVSRHEYAVYQESHSPELVELAHFLFDEYDVDNDHHLEAHDYENFYRLMDNDGDDSVSEAEFRNYWSVLLHSVAHAIPTNIPTTAAPMATSTTAP